MERGTGRKHRRKLTRDPAEAEDEGRHSSSHQETMPTTARRHVRHDILKERNRFPRAGATGEYESMKE